MIGWDSWSLMPFQVDLKFLFGLLIALVFDRAIKGLFGKFFKQCFWFWVLKKAFEKVKIEKCF